ncbi:Conserved_hypothetical protein [Hexamita inflata]|uniref:Uncharacterized protein n=1 Tax=Hexamita inflata TaxID=28002 RepID=A0AA86THL3_9EUKA|nr:Conserved hypothetical protein [Hexamita inflata]
MAKQITLDDNENQIRQKVGQNNTYFIINDKQQLADSISYSNPMIFSKVSKDVVFLFDNFKEVEILNITILETCSLIDRIWIFTFNNTKLINVVQDIFNVSYLSLVQIMFKQQYIQQYILQLVDSTPRTLNLKLIQDIQVQIQKASISQTYKVYNDSQVYSSSTYTVFLLFTQMCNYLNNCFSKYAVEDQLS